jgi:hypothetical protein
MPKKRLTLRVDENEVAVVGPVDRWQHLVTTYEFLASVYPEDENAWLEAAEWIRTGLASAKRISEHECKCSKPCGC